MINSIDSGMSMPPQHSGSSKQQSLTMSQQSLINETLSQYDVDNLTEADAKNIVKTFSEAGIQPSAAFETAIAEEGFDAKTIGELSGAEKGNRPPPPPKQGVEEITSMVDYLTTLMEEKLSESNSTSLSAEDKESILAQVFEKYNIDEGESIINTTA